MSFRSRCAAAFAGLLTSTLISFSSVTVADTAAGRNGASELPPVPQRVQVNLNRSERGRSALSALQRSGRITQWAAGYGLSRSQVESLFNSDNRAYVDKRGSLMFIEHLEPSFANQPTLTSNNNTLINQTDLINQVFTLHSSPGSQRKLYLDFDGHVTQGTAWNDAYGLASITHPAFDLDGVPGTFNTAERLAMLGIWQRVKEDFAPFDIDVTTEEPPADLMTRSSSQDGSFGVRIVITRDFTPGTREGACQCGGFAYVGVFSDTSEFYKPGFVFYNNLGSNEKFVAEAVTHEAGHTMGLSHDGKGTLGYYEGHGTGTATGWAPIMGVGYYKPLTQWSKGEYSGANNREDDFLVLQNNGVRFATDEHGNNIATATALTPTLVNGLNRFAASGVIQGPTDIDFFRITAGAGALSVTVSPDAYDPNLDAVVTLFNSAGTQIALANPVDALNAALSFNVTTAGTYYLSVRGTGNGSPATTGYSAYGSIGSYSLTATAPIQNVVSVPPLARLAANRTAGPAPLAVTFSAATSTGSGNLTYLWNYGDGTQASGVTPPVKTFSQAGNFTVTLRVTDASGSSSTASTVIRTTAPPAARSMGVAQFSVAGVVPNPNRPDAFARATVTVRDSTGRPVPNAQVTGTWSGVVNSAASGVTNAAGQALIASPTTPFVGSFNFTITNITAPGLVYDPRRNVMNSRSITF
jgi:PKD repeat protein